jgi:hypothetical protein
VATSQQGEYPISYAKQRIGSTFHSALVFKLFLSNAKLGQAEIWTASQQGYHLPPQKFQRNPLRHLGFMIKSLTVAATGNSVAPLLKRLCRFRSATSVSNISLTITHFEKLREVFVIWYVMNKNLLQFSKIPSHLFIIQVLS